MQEFKTACYVVHDSELLHEDMLAGSGCPWSSPHSVHLADSHGLAGRSAVRQVPIVASFIANHPDGSPFKVSIHSWTLPDLSRELKQLETRDKALCFEARVIIDGICVGCAFSTTQETACPDFFVGLSL
jgi:hypothetical protein